MYSDIIKDIYSNHLKKVPSLIKLKQMTVIIKDNIENSDIRKVV